MERLIEQGCDIEARHSRTNRNALLVAAHCGNDDVVDLLIQNHAKLNVIDRERCTALHLSASRGHRGVLEILLEESRDLIEVPNSDGQTALRVAADFGQLETVYMLLAYHAQVNARAENQMTALVSYFSTLPKKIHYLMYPAETFLTITLARRCTKRR